MSTDTSNRALIIPPEVLALPIDLITWSARLVLSEIIDLHRPHHYVFAMDDHFAERCLMKKRTVEDAMTQLHKAGLILRDVDQKRPYWCRRIITPQVPGLVFGPPTAKEKLAYAPTASKDKGASLPTAESAVGLSETETGKAPELPTADIAVAPQQLAQPSPLAPAISAVGMGDLPQNLRQAPAISAVDLPQNLRQAPAISADINNSLNTRVNTKEEPIPTAASPAGSGESSLEGEELAAEQKKIQERFARWQAWAKENAPQVLKMKVPLTADKFNDLRSKWGVTMLQEVFSDMDNWAPLLTKNRNAWKTADTWCRKRKEQPLPQKGKITQGITPTRTSDSLADKIHGQQTKVIE
ncbi:hypothetical protein KLP40_19335 [Hymenobacter sp. NST-14]|uniref:hypothetical protein n=1 Tax=Hymenobacter piscis TaxID=2839984 RepID=UPI001C02DFEE|nr:hypothetical protein [Hymenobacter piscis]MBT9395329.1 hypothetical protein [Hymenobacter piscis]